MSKVDKKSIIVLLILAIIFTIVSPITVNAATIEVDPALENSGVTAMVLGNRALLSDGSLWKIESETSAKIEDKGVKAYNYIYSRYTSSKYDYYAKLKNDNTLNVKMTETDKDASVKDEKNISNVKKIIEHYEGRFLAYLTYTNEVYFLDPYEGKDNIQFNLVAKDVEKVMGQYYIKDGKTYLVSGQKVLDKVIDKAYKDFCSVGNILYQGIYYSEDYFRFYEYATDFEDFTDTKNINGWMTYKSTDGTIKETGDYSSSQQIYNWHAVDGSINYYLSGTNVFVKKSNTVFVLLKNVVDMELIDSTTLAFVRSDGTIWTNKLWESKSCSKLISPKVSKFSDINPTSWYFNAVNYAVNNNILSGLNETTFGPNDKLTRGMMVTILYRMEGNPAVPSSAPTFTDVKDNKKWYYKAVRWAAAKGIVSGYNDGKFGPTDNITREQLAIILYKYAKYKGKDVSKANDLSGFTDSNKVASYALKQVKWAVGAGVITGSNGKLNPKGNATRAEVAAMMEKYCKKVGR